MKRVAVYGGSFNPPHVGHVMWVSWLLAAGDVDEVWVFPSYQHTIKGPSSTSFDDRTEMCRLAFRGVHGEQRVRVFQTERLLSGHSLDLVKYLQQTEPNCTFRFVIGSDLLGEGLALWPGFAELCRLAPPIVFPRPGYPVVDGMHVEFLASVKATVAPEALALEIASSELRRQYLLTGAWPSGALPMAVLKFLTKEKEAV